MELQTIKTQTTWQDAVTALNANSQAIQIEFEKVGEKNRGYYVSVESLNAAHATGNIGDIAYVGTTAPFAIYTWNGESWEDTGTTGGIEEVDLSGFLPNTGGTLSGDLEVVGSISTQEAIECGSMRVNDTLETISLQSEEIETESITATTIKVNEGLETEILMANGDRKNISQLGALQAIATTDETEYKEVF